MNKTIYLIDGYNLIRKNPAAFSSMNSLEKKREHLIKLLRSDPELKKSEITVVFDGTPAEFPREKLRTSRIRILFSAKPEEADDIIRDIVRKKATGGNLIVVSSDRVIQNSATVHGASVMNSENFWRKIGKKKTKGASIQEGTAFQDRELSEREVKKWMELFQKHSGDQSEN